MPEDEGAPGEGNEAEVDDAPAPEREGRREPPRTPSPDHEQAQQGKRSPPSANAREPEPSKGPHRMRDADARTWAAGAHLSAFVGLVGVPPVLGPLVVWLVKRGDHPFLDDQAREALNFQISVMIYAIVGALAAVLFALATMGLGIVVVIPVVVIFALGVLLLPIIAAVKASDGESYRYPLTLRLISGAQTGASGARANS